MNEALLNFMGKDIGTPEGQSFAIKVLNYLRELMIEFQTETGLSYNLEPPPLKGQATALPDLTRSFMPTLSPAEERVPYTNSAQLPANYRRYNGVCETARRNSIAVYGRYCTTLVSWRKSK